MWSSFLIDASGNRCEPKNSEQNLLRAEDAAEAVVLLVPPDDFSALVLTNLLRNSSGPPLGGGNQLQLCESCSTTPVRLEEEELFKRSTDL